MKKLKMAAAALALSAVAVFAPTSLAADEPTVQTVYYNNHHVYSSGVYVEASPSYNSYYYPYNDYGSGYYYAPSDSYGSGYGYGNRYGGYGGGYYVGGGYGHGYRR